MPQLEYIAYAMCERGSQRIAESDLLDLLQQVIYRYANLHNVQRRSAPSQCCQLERRTGILVEAGRERIHGQWRTVCLFRHLTFQDYLAAQAPRNRSHFIKSAVSVCRRARAATSTTH